MAQTQQKLTAGQRAILFAQATRKYTQTLSTINFQELSTVRQLLPKARFLEKIYLHVQGSFKAKHATKTKFNMRAWDMFNLIKQIRVSSNGAFNPYQISGAMLRYYNLLDNYSNKELGTNVHNINTIGTTVSSAGTVNKVDFWLELPITLNERDTVGLILLQSDSTNINVEIDCGRLSDVLTQTDSDVVLDSDQITITPIIDTFSIPVNNPDAIPDYSVIKIVNEQSENTVSNGDLTIKLPTQITYRKLFIYMGSDTYGTPITLDKIGNVQLLFNQADAPLQIPMDYIAYRNAQDYQNSLPDGCYVLDFSSQGIANMGGARDYVDAEKLTELWLRINFKDLSGNTNFVVVGAEKLAQLV